MPEQRSIRDRLLDIFNGLKLVETKGESTLIMADCLRELANIVNNMPIEDKKGDEE